MAEPLDLQEVRATWLQQCGPCDYGVTSAPCNCPPGDYRPVLLRAADELDQLRTDRARWSFAAGYLRGELAGLVAAMPAGPARVAAEQNLAQVDALLFPRPGGGWGWGREPHPGRPAAAPRADGGGPWVTARRSSGATPRSTWLPDALGFPPVATTATSSGRRRSARTAAGSAIRASEHQQG